MMTKRIKFEDKPVYSYIKEKLINCVLICKDQEAAMTKNTNKFTTTAKP